MLAEQTLLFNAHAPSIPPPPSTSGGLAPPRPRLCGFLGERPLQRRVEDVAARDERPRGTDGGFCGEEIKWRGKWAFGPAEPIPIPDQNANRILKAKATLEMSRKSSQIPKPTLNWIPIQIPNAASHPKSNQNQIQISSKLHFKTKVTTQCAPEAREGKKPQSSNSQLTTPWRLVLESGRCPQVVPRPVPARGQQVYGPLPGWCFAFRRVP